MADSRMLRDASNAELEAELSNAAHPARWNKYSIRLELAFRWKIAILPIYAADLALTDPVDIETALVRVGLWKSGESTLTTRHRVRLERRLLNLLGSKCPIDILRRHGFDGAKRIGHKTEAKWDSLGPFILGEPAERTRERAALERYMLARNIRPRSYKLQQALERRETTLKGKQ